MDWLHGLLPWLGALLCAVLLAFVVVRCPLRLEVSGHARGEPDGRWVAAGGVSLSVLSVAFVWARGVPLQLSFLLFGHKVAWKPHWSQRLARPVPERVKAASRKAWGKVAPLDLALQLLSERRHFRLRYLVFDLAYGFRDPMLTGRLVGALYALSAVLPAAVEIRQAPRWDFEDAWDVAVDGRAVVRPWLVLLDVGFFVLGRLTARTPRAEPPLPASGLNEVR